ncbi:TM2 domain-containing protein [Sabulilitoribacter arenilitoris]|uniref:TM2 domain-containing protein n=1 Tax=Wocania arenilitoris TaxID=2044858 RepID=A0AAE3EPN7_9FLAO|nr:TM2 domain-containing protein [Wocania arenilitoris]MCF7567919.1 TM2 domain-containing protein [Wocania arenilitoris]
MLLVLFAYSSSYASFPVKRTVTKTEITNNSSEETYTAAAATAAQKDLTVGIVLWFFLGWAAGHRWYYGKPVGWNILFILTAGGLGVWWVIDLINMIQGNF